MQEAEQILQTRHFNLSDKTFQSESPRTICTPRKHAFSSLAVSKNFILGNIIEEIEKTERPSHKKMSSKRQNLKQCEELKVKTNRQKQSHHHPPNRQLKRRKQKPSSRVKIHSPRMVSKVEICKIKALEDMKKLNMQWSYYE